MDKRIKKLLGVGTCIVDIGCGSGRMLVDSSDNFDQRIGLDLSNRRLEEMSGGRSEGWEFREADLNEDFPLEDSCADAVMANQVIEHILDPLKFCSEIYRILKPGGRCVITTPNIRYVKNVAHIIFSGYGPRTAGGNTRDGNWDDGHIHYFTHRDLRELFSHIGFSQVHSSALIDIDGGGYLRKIMNRYALAWPIREFLSGNILIWVEK